MPCWDVRHWCATSDYSTLKTQMMMMMMMMRRCKHSARPWRERETGRLWNVEAAADTNEDEFRLRNMVLHLPGHHQRQWIRLQDRHLVRTAVVLLLFLSRSLLSSLTFIIIIYRPSFTVVDCRRPSFSGRRCSCLERSTTSHLHRPSEFSVIVRWLTVSDVPFPTICSACEVNCVIIGTL